MWIGAPVNWFRLLFVCIYLLASVLCLFRSIFPLVSEAIRTRAQVVFFLFISFEIVSDTIWSNNCLVHGKKMIIIINHIAHAWAFEVI